MACLVLAETITSKVSTSRIILIDLINIRVFDWKTIRITAGKSKAYMASDTFSIRIFKELYWCSIGVGWSIWKSRDANAQKRKEELEYRAQTLKSTIETEENRAEKKNTSRMRLQKKPVILDRTDISKLTRNSIRSEREKQ